MSSRPSPLMSPVPTPWPAAALRSQAIIDRLGEMPGGADVFSFHANFTVDAGPLQFFLFGSRSLWDIDAPKKDFVYEYGNGLLIKPSDRIHYGLAQLSFGLNPISALGSVSSSGLAVRNQFWNAFRTGRNKNLVSAGITGFRIGRNSAGHRRGLDLSLGYWTTHPQIQDGDAWTKSLMFLADWKWNIQVLHL